jgi:hypothetical protein
MAILRFFAGVLESLDVEQAKGFLVHVLNPIHRITDESGDLSAAQGESIGKSIIPTFHQAISCSLLRRIT